MFFRAHVALALVAASCGKDSELVCRVWWCVAAPHLKLVAGHPLVSGLSQKRNLRSMLSLEASPASAL
eukprot:3858676-Amphidinium_carterae.1